MPSLRYSVTASYIKWSETGPKARNIYPLSLYGKSMLTPNWPSVVGQQTDLPPITTHGNIHLLKCFKDKAFIITSIKSWWMWQFLVGPFPGSQEVPATWATHILCSSLCLLTKHSVLVHFSAHPSWVGLCIPASPLCLGSSHMSLTLSPSLL